MKTLLTLSFVAIALSMSSCKKQNKGASTTTIEVTVKSGATQAVSNGATVNLFTDATAATAGSTPNYTGTTDQTGKATFSNVNSGTYYVVAINGSARNYYNGLIPIGISNGTVTFQDTNGDGQISAQDKVLAPSVSVASGATSTFTAIIY